EPVLLEAGDLVTFPHGHGHLLGNGRTSTIIDGRATLPTVLANGLQAIRMGGGGPPSCFICGYLVCDPQMSQTFLGGLPPLMKVTIRDDDSGRWLETSLKFSVAEAAAHREGADAMLAKLSEVVFAETLRRYMRMLPPEHTGWMAAARDPEVGAALTLL